MRKCTWDLELIEVDQGAEFLWGSLERFIMVWLRMERIRWAALRWRRFWRSFRVIWALLKSRCLMPILDMKPCNTLSSFLSSTLSLGLTEISGYPIFTFTLSIN